MSNLKCEYPEGCRLDLWAKVTKGKCIEKQALILDINFTVPADQVGGKITSIKHVMADVLGKWGECQFSTVKIYIEYQIIMTVAVGTDFHVVTLGEVYEKVIDLEECDPPLSLEEFRNEIQTVDIELMNWDFIYDIKGNSEDECNPCHMTSPVVGTCIGLQVYVDIITKLNKMHSIIVYGELDPETDC
jgi:hypothetical protein